MTIENAPIAENNRSNKLFNKIRQAFTGKGNEVSRSIGKTIPLIILAAVLASCNEAPDYYSQDPGVMRAKMVKANNEKYYQEQTQEAISQPNYLDSTVESYKTRQEVTPVPEPIVTVCDVNYGDTILSILEKQNITDPYNSVSYIGVAKAQEEGVGFRTDFYPMDEVLAGKVDQVYLTQSDKVIFYEGVGSIDDVKLQASNALQKHTLVSQN